MQSQPSLARFQDALGSKRYVVVPEDLAISKEERLALCSSVFGQDQLEADRPDIHPHRLRADAILTFEWHNDDVKIMLGPNAAADSENRQVIRYTANTQGDREYKRLRVLESSSLCALLLRICQLVPKEVRRSRGLLGVHAFRTFKEIVFAPHRDGSADAPVDWVVSYVVNRRGDGGESRLTLDPAGAHLVARSVLGPGELMMHHDATFFHYVTPLVSSDGLAPEREVIIVTVRPPLQ